MQISESGHLTYCTNLHPAETWEETFVALDTYTLAFKRSFLPSSKPFGIGLRLSSVAARELLEGSALLKFQEWLEQNNLYVFTINAFPYGPFHGQAVKENVYKPDWTQPERLEYTINCAEVLARLLPPGVLGTISTLPGSFKAFGADEGLIFRQLHKAAQALEGISEKYETSITLALEPEPLCLFETIDETISFFHRLYESGNNSALLKKRLGLTYDCCHLALEYEDAESALARLVQAEVSALKVHLSNALSLDPRVFRALDLLKSFEEPTYLHQVLARNGKGEIFRYRDLPEAFEYHRHHPDSAEEWRVHFHIPLYSVPEKPLNSTKAHLEQVLGYFRANPTKCSHFEIETYTFNVLPKSMSAPLLEHLAKEYSWVLARMAS